MDRLISEHTLTEATVAQMKGTDNMHFADGSPRPSRWAGRTLLGFAGVTFSLALAPFVLLRSCGSGRRARRNRRFVAVVASFLVPLMAVNPEALANLHVEALTARATLAALGTPQSGETLTEYEYDANGNLTVKRVDGLVKAEYAYDGENRLVRFDPQEGLEKVVYYAYETDGIRRSKTTAGVTTLFTTDKNRPYAQVLEERDADDVTSGIAKMLKRYVYGHDLISQTKDPEGGMPETRYFFYDGQMSTRVLTDATGEQTDKYTYDAFGNKRTTAADHPTDNAYRYTGEQFDETLGHNYLRVSSDSEAAKIVSFIYSAITGISTAYVTKTIRRILSDEI